MNGHRPLYEDIVMKARAAKLAGATVLRGPMGYGLHAKIHTAKILDLSAKLPLVIEIVDAEENIRAFVGELNGCCHVNAARTQLGAGGRRSGSRGRRRPRRHGLGPEPAEGGSADQVTLDIEGVVDGGVGGEEALG